MCWSRSQSFILLKASEGQTLLSLSESCMDAFSSSLLKSWQVCPQPSIMSAGDKPLRLHRLASFSDAWSCKETAVRISERSERNGEVDGDGYAEI